MQRETQGTAALRTPRVAIIGGGMSGIGMAVKLRRAGIDSFHIYEMWSDIGGTWHANTYPGLHCDVPSRNYQYPYEPNPNWSKLFSGGREIWEYLDSIVRKYDLRAQTSLSTEVERAVWDGREWTVTTKAGDSAVYDFLITAAGGLVRTKTPDLPGLDDFRGAAFHSAEWDHSVPLEGRRVAVVGTGSTGMQITRALAPVARSFELFQRTPQWIFPLPNKRYTPLTKWVYRRFPQLNEVVYRRYTRFFEGTFGAAVLKPGWQRKMMQGLCRLHLRTVRDPDLRRRFTPTDQPMCKRLVMGTGFYKQFKRPNVDLVDTPIERVEANGIRTTDGVLHELDVIVLATGFNAHTFVLPMELVGRDGVRLSDVWATEPYGYRSVAIPDFPNVFMLIGPHSPFGNQSLFGISDVQSTFAMRCIDLWRRGEIEAMAPTREATDRFNASMREALPDTVWATGCKSWYIGADGLPAAWPWTAAHHRDVLEEPEFADWDVERVPAGRA
jgi:cation diffusion facilitator CzcD-associated flavoprotein CzcO